MAYTNKLLGLFAWILLHVRLRLAQPEEISESFGDEEFVAVLQNSDFEIAKADCVTLGGTLARISSTEEHDFVTVFLDSINNLDRNQDVWIGRFVSCFFF